jgi:hypothetical protein
VFYEFWPIYNFIFFFLGGMSIDYHLEKAQLDFSRHFPKK